MASLIDNLIDILEQECTAYEELLGLSMKKTSAIVAANLEELQRITDDEQILVSRVTKLDAKRSETTKDIATVTNTDVNELKLSNLVEMLKSRPQESGRLAAVHDKLKDLVGQIKRVNEQNKDLLERSLEMVEFDLTLLQAMKSGPQTANYNRGAYSAGVVLGPEAGGFDAKS